MRPQGWAQVPVWFWFVAGTAFGSLVPVALHVPVVAYAAGAIGAALMGLLAVTQRRQRAAETDDELLATRRLLGGGRRVIPSDPIERVLVLRVHAP